MSFLNKEWIQIIYLTPFCFTIFSMSIPKREIGVVLLIKYYQLKYWVALNGVILIELILVA